MASEYEIRETLEAVKNHFDDDAFAILTLGGREKFVQFCGCKLHPRSGKHEPVMALLLDLPLRSLDEDEAERAAKLFAEHGVSGPTEGDAIDAVSLKKFFVPSYRLVCDDADDAAKAGIAVIRDVLGCDDLESVDIETNGI